MAGGSLLQSAATSTGNGNEINCLGLDGRHVLTVVGTGTVSAGGVLWETAHTSGYSGAWRAISAELFPTADTVVSATYEGPLHWVRCRVTTAVTGGGSVTVRMQPANGSL